MKNKEVCEKTGLTERTIRYYEQEGLISPDTQERAGRVYRNYSMEDVKELENIAHLRRLLFSIDEIKTMKTDPTQIPTVLEEYRRRMGTMRDQMSDVLLLIDGMDIHAVTSVSDLSSQFSQAASRRLLPQRDVRPNFGRFDEIDEQEKKEEIARGERETKQRVERGKKMVMTMLLVEMILSIVNLFISFSISNVVALIVQILFCVGIAEGKNWVRYLYAVLCLFNVINLMVILVSTGAAASGWVNGLGLAMLLWRSVCCVLLFASKSVDAYLEYKRG